MYTRIIQKNDLKWLSLNTEAGTVQRLNEHNIDTFLLT